jgi:lactobin A/cerein 7B family class IIb bacteriocin
MDMTMQIAAAPTSDLRILTDDELDNVNGGFIWLFLGGAALITLAAAGGYMAGRAIARALD